MALDYGQRAPWVGQPGQPPEEAPQEMPAEYRRFDGIQRPEGNHLTLFERRRAPLCFTPAHYNPAVGLLRVPNEPMRLTQAMRHDRAVEVGGYGARRPKEVRKLNGEFSDRLRDVRDRDKTEAQAKLDAQRQGRLRWWHTRETEDVKDPLKTLKFQNYTVVPEMLNAARDIVIVNLTGCRLGTDGMTYVSTFLAQNSGTLRRLNLQGNKINPEGVENLRSGLKAATALTDLDLSLNPLTDDGLSSVVGAFNENLRNTKIAKLNVSTCDLGGGAGYHLSRFMRDIRSVRVVIAWRNRIGQSTPPVTSGISMVFDELAVTKTMIHVDLSCNCIDDAVAAAHAEMMERSARERRLLHIDRRKRTAHIAEMTALVDEKRGNAVWEDEKVELAGLERELAFEVAKLRQIVEEEASERRTKEVDAEWREYIKSRTGKEVHDDELKVRLILTGNHSVTSGSLRRLSQFYDLTQKADYEEWVHRRRRLDELIKPRREVGQLDSLQIQEQRDTEHYTAHDGIFTFEAEMRRRDDAARQELRQALAARDYSAGGFASLEKNAEQRSAARFPEEITQAETLLAEMSLEAQKNKEQFDDEENPLDEAEPFDSAAMSPPMSPPTAGFTFDDQAEAAAVNAVLNEAAAVEETVAPTQRRAQISRSKQIRKGASVGISVNQRTATKKPRGADDDDGTPYSTSPPRSTRNELSSGMTADLSAPAFTVGGGLSPGVAANVPSPNTGTAIDMSAVEPPAALAPIASATAADDDEAPAADAYATDAAAVPEQQVEAVDTDVVEDPFAAATAAAAAAGVAKAAEQPGYEEEEDVEPPEDEEDEEELDDVAAFDIDDVDVDDGAAAALLAKLAPPPEPEEDPAAVMKRLEERTKEMRAAAQARAEEVRADATEALQEVIQQTKEEGIEVDVNAGAEASAVATATVQRSRPGSAAVATRDDASAAAGAGAAAATVEEAEETATKVGLALLCKGIAEVIAMWESIRALSEVGSPSPDDLARLDQETKRCDKLKADFAAGLAAHVAESGAKVEPQGDEVEAVFNFFEDMLKQNGEEPSNVRLVEAIIANVALDYSSLIDSRGLATLCACDGNIEFLRPLLAIEGLEFDVAEFMCACFYNQSMRIPLALLAITAPGLDLATFSDDLAEQWQEFFEDVASEKRAIPREKRQEKLALLEAMLQHEAFDIDATAQGPDGLTVFARACIEGDIATAELLSEFNVLPDPAVLHNDGSTVLISAVIGNSVECVKLIFEHEALRTVSVNHASANGTAFDLAVMLKRDPAIAAVLKEKGAKAKVATKKPAAKKPAGKKPAAKGAKKPVGKKGR